MAGTKAKGRGPASLLDRVRHRAEEGWERALRLLPASPRRAIRGLPKRAERLRSQAEKAVERSWDRALEVLPASQKKAVKELPKRVEKLARDLERRRDQTLKRVEARRKRLVSDFENRAFNTLKPFVQRLDVATRSDVERLSRRIGQLERKLQRRVTQRPSAPAAAA